MTLAWRICAYVGAFVIGLAVATVLVAAAIIVFVALHG